MPPGIGKPFQSGLRQTQPAEYFSEETEMVLQLANLFFCTCVYPSTAEPPRLPSLWRSLTPPHAHDMVTCAAAAATTANTTLRSTEGPRQQDSSIPDLDGQATGARFPPSDMVIK